VLLITGAGGSIGSELKPVCVTSPPVGILVDRQRTRLFQLGLDLRPTDRSHFVPVIADIQDVSAMREIFALHRP